MTSPTRAPTVARARRARLEPMRAETIMADVTAALDAELPPGDA